MLHCYKNWHMFNDYKLVRKVWGISLFNKYAIIQVETALQIPNMLYTELDKTF